MHRYSQTRLDALAQLAPFRACTRRQLRHVDSLMTSTRAPAGRVLASQGDPARQCFLLEEGAVEVTCNGTLVNEAGPGSWLGEMALLDGTPRNATLIASTPIVLSVLNPREFATLLADLPSVADHIRRQATERRRVLDRVSSTSRSALLQLAGQPA